MERKQRGRRRRRGREKGFSGGQCGGGGVACCLFRTGGYWQRAPVGLSLKATLSLSLSLSSLPVACWKYTAGLARKRPIQISEKITHFCFLSLTLAAVLSSSLKRRSLSIGLQPPLFLPLSLSLPSPLMG